MLRYSVWPLPAEIYAMIYSNLSAIHLAAVQQTCRQLYAITSPYVWQSVDIESLLQLLPGCTTRLGTPPRIEIATPSPVPDDYFNRFFYYSRFVKCLKIAPQFLISGSFQDDSNEVAVLAKTTDHFTLPNVRQVTLTIVENGHRRYRDEYEDYGFWVEALVPPTIERISFEAFSSANESLLRALVVKAPDLSRLEVACDIRPSQFYKELLGPSAMSNVRSLRYSGSLMDPDILEWFAHIPQLATLELTIDPEDSEDPMLPEIEYQPESFRALTTLKIFTCDHGEIAEQWNLLKQMWKTPLVRLLTCVEIRVSEPIYPGAEEVEQFMSVLVAHSPHVSSLQIGASGQPEHFPEIPFDFLTDIRRLPLRSLNLQSPIHLKDGQLLFKDLGKIFPNLEDLDLGSTPVEVSDLMSAQSYLPKLRYLNTSTWQTKTNKKKLERTLFSKRTDLLFPTQPPRGSSLSLRFRARNPSPDLRAYNLDFSDMDMIAILLATRWAGIYVYGDLLADRMDALHTRIEFWQRKACRDWGRLADCVSFQKRCG